MFEIPGKYTNVKVMIDEVDSETLSQIYHIASAPAAENTNVVIMPDTHAGKGCVIGFTQKLDKNNPRVVPNLLGVDISCTISSYNLGHMADVDFEQFDKFIRANIPLGAGSYLQKRDKKLDDKYITKTAIELFNAAINLLFNINCLSILLFPFSADSMKPHIFASTKKISFFPLFNTLIIKSGAPNPLLLPNSYSSNKSILGLNIFFRL